MPSREETETVIVLHNADDFAVVDTMHGRFRRACEEVIRRTGKGRERNPEGGVVAGRKVRWEFEIPKDCIQAPRAPTRRELSEDQRRTLAERGRAVLARRRAELTQAGAADTSGEGADTAPVAEAAR